MKLVIEYHSAGDDCDSLADVPLTHQQLLELADPDNTEGHFQLAELVLDTMYAIEQKEAARAVMNQLRAESHPVPPPRTTYLN